VADPLEGPVARDERNRVVVTVETDADVGGCPFCGVVAVGHGRRVHVAANAPCFRGVTVVRWREAPVAVRRARLPGGDL
jgi:phage terminase large subunit-like protein